MDQTMKETKKFSLIELMMIIMLVGIIVTVSVMISTYKDGRAKTTEAVVNMQVLATDRYAAFNDTTFSGDYVIDWDALSSKYAKKLDGQQLSAKYFEYTVTDTLITAVSNDEFGTEGATINYYVPSGPFSIGEDDTSKNALDRAWLP